MPKELEPSNNEKAFILDALNQGIRLDERDFEKFRELQLEFGKDYGLADVRLGNTRVIARVSAEVVQPFADRPFDGIFNITTELGPMASPAFEVGRQTEQEVLLARLIEKAIRRSGAIDTESLCIVAGQKCWQVRADVHFINHDGGLVDASCIAVIAALQHFRRPDVSVDGEVVTIHTMEERVPVALSILHVPICVTFSFYGETAGGAVIMDATLQEEQLREGDMTITMNKFGEVCQVSKAGGLALDGTEMLNCMRKALVKVQEITEFVDRKLKEDMDARMRKDNLLEGTAANER